MERGRGLAVAGVVALAAVDVVLVGWAFRPTEVESALGLPTALLTDPTGTSSVPVGATPTPSATPRGSQSASPSTSSGSPDPADPAPLTVTVAAVDGDTVWVAGPGTCGTPGDVWVTGDGGATWDRHDAPGGVLRVRPTSPTDAFVTGGDADCRLRLWSTGDSGGDWSGQDVRRAWSRVPDEPREVHTPADAVVRPCGPRDVLDLAVRGADRALVACADGAVRSTSDKGASWAKVYEVDGLLALAVADDGTGVAAASVPSCDGVRVVPVDESGSTGKGRCVEADVTAGRVGVSVAAGGAWLLVGDAVFHADDPAGSWSATAARPAG